MYLKYISMLPEFELSKTFYEYFDILFQMGIMEFKDYLKSCTFQTGQVNIGVSCYR
jgi:hypothetical protein